MSNIINLLSNFFAIQGTKFVSLNYTNQNGETSLYTILVGAKLVNSYQKDLAKLIRMKESNTLNATELIACNELIDSINESLNKGIGNNSRYTKQGYYTHADNNIKSSEISQMIYLNGFVIRKTIIKKGEYKSVKSSDKTIAKNRLKKDLRMSKFREFRFDASQIKEAKINGNKITIVS